MFFVLRGAKIPTLKMQKCTPSEGNLLPMCIVKPSFCLPVVITNGLPKHHDLTLSSSLGDISADLTYLEELKKPRPNLEKISQICWDNTVGINQTPPFKNLLQVSPIEILGNDQT